MVGTNAGRKWYTEVDFPAGRAVRFLSSGVLWCALDFVVVFQVSLCESIDLKSVSL